MSEQKGAKTYALTAATATTAGGVLSVANPEGADIIVTGVYLDVTTAATGAATVDAGIAANGTTSADNLIDAGDVGTAAAVISNRDNAGVNGKQARRWNSGEFLTITASATTAGMVGNAYVTYVRV